MKQFEPQLTNRPLLWLFVIVGLSAITSFTVAKLAMPKPGNAHRNEDTSASLHAWVHENLTFTPEQEKILHPLEHEFEAKEAELNAQIHKASRVLAHSLETDTSGSPDFETALADVQLAQGELQRLTFQHFFEMKEHLTPQQREKLLQWTHDSIAHDHPH